MSFFSDIGAGLNSLLNDGAIDYDGDDFENVALDAMKEGTSSKDAATLLATWRSSNNLAKKMDSKQQDGIGFFQNDVLISAKNWIDKIIKQFKLKRGSFFQNINFSYPSIKEGLNMKNTGENSGKDVVHTSNKIERERERERSLGGR